VATPAVAGEQSIHWPRMRHSLSYNDKHRQESNATVTQRTKSDICQKHKKLGAIFNSLIICYEENKFRYRYRLTFVLHIWERKYPTSVCRLVWNFCFIFSFVDTYQLGLWCTNKLRWSSYTKKLSFTRLLCCFVFFSSCFDKEGWKLVKRHFTFVLLKNHPKGKIDCRHGTTSVF